MALVLATLTAAPAGAAVVEFQDGAGGYGGTRDTELQSGNPDTVLGSQTPISVDQSDAGNGTLQGLLRFEGIFGNGAGLIPPGSTINSASLTLEWTNITPGTIGLHRMLATWSEASTWNLMSGGIQTDDVEARAASVGFVPTFGPFTVNGLAPDLQAWSDGASNHGWAVINPDANGADFQSSEWTTPGQRPKLTVDYTPPATISGTVFEDVNYGGGPGRDYATAKADATAFVVERDGVVVELYAAGGSFLGSTTTAGGGGYSFAVSSGSFTVRIVGGTVTSSRPGADGSELLVQTYRADGLSEGAGEGADRVGGERPSHEDAAANSGAQSLAALQGTDVDGDGVLEWTQSIVTVDTSGGDVTGVDFGFNADLIVNTNDSGQGSLRQFILNANLLQ